MIEKKGVKWLVYSRVCACAVTFRCVEDCPGLAPPGLPVDAVGQRADKVVLRALHDLLAHLVELLSVVNPTVELGVGVRELCETSGVIDAGRHTAQVVSVRLNYGELRVDL